MSAKEAKARIQRFIDCDKLDCNDFQNAHGFGYPPIEERLAFLEHRFKNLAGAVVFALMEMDESTSGTTEEKP